MNVRVFTLRLHDDYLSHDHEAMNSFLNTVQVKKTASEFIYGELNQWSILVYYEQQAKGVSQHTASAPKLPDIELNFEEQKLFEALKHWRAGKAQVMQIQQFMICHNRELMMLAKIKPQSVDELSAIRGFGDQKVARYGKELIDIVHK